MRSKRKLLNTLVMIMLFPALSFAQKNTAYKADIPDAIKTLDIVETEHLGTLNFYDGMPDEATTKKVYDNLDLYRGVDAFQKGIPAASIYAMREGLRSAGVEPHDIGIFEDLMDARTLLLSANSTTIYILTVFDLRDGPIVLEAPANVLGPLDDAYFRFVTDIGLTGPDKGKGGKYLLVPPGYEGELPESGYFITHTKTYSNWLLMRAFVQNGDKPATVKAVKDEMRIYPYSAVNNPPEQKFVNLSGMKFNTIHSNNYDFYNELNQVIQEEPFDAFNPEILGLFASIGINKGQEFNPDDRMKKILTEAVAIGNATARAIVFRPRNENTYFYSDRKWYSPFAGGSHEFINNGARVLDDRTMFHYYATGITPAMAKPKVGTGSAYELTAQDSEGNYLDGGKNYKITLPGPVPAKKFWSFMVYDGITRSMLETDQKFAGLDSENPSVKPNKDGSYTMWFGPKSPKGYEGNWIQTMPGKSWNVLLRLYGPEQAWFDKTWKPGDFELIQSASPVQDN
jgi:hypothetical protein